MRSLADLASATAVTLHLRFAVDHFAPPASAGMRLSRATKKRTRCLKKKCAVDQAYSAIFIKLSISLEAALAPESVISRLKIEAENLRSRRGELEASLVKCQIPLSQVKELTPFFRRQEARNTASNLNRLIAHHQRIQEKIDTDYDRVVEYLEKRVNKFFSKDLINEIYSRIDPHPDFKTIELKCDFKGDSGPRLEVLLKDENNKLNAPAFHFSSAQPNILSLSIFLARAIHARNANISIDTILIDDPIHSMDSINILSTIDILRNICCNLNKKIIISTHDENFFRLLKKKIPENLYNSKFIELETYGKVARRE
ncbi:hypothetical protein JO408_24460 [Pseudomonas aeruginosa]|uniref:hypothetical protein n=1 Tax=Pseudomonas aeruginosa TaxID=287 RepID=UPI001C8DABCE|nr:hypothetical protein [Pseudomonas aeruginosa]MBX9503597.1 hypothetical protein [Pseudomonas aeruginosa]